MMRRTRIVFVVALALFMALATWVVGWWMVPVVAFVAGTREREGGPSPLLVALGAALGWALLLGRDAASPGFGALLQALAGIMRLPGAAIVVVALLLAWGLGWSGAAVGAAAGAVMRR